MTTNDAASEDSFDGPEAGHAILLRKDSVFLLKRSNTGTRDGFWNLPSGRREGLESLLETCSREGEEETGVACFPKKDRPVHVFVTSVPDKDGNARDCRLMFVEMDFRGEPSLNEPEKASECGWFPLAELPEPMVGHQAKVLSNWKNRDTTAFPKKKTSMD